MEGQMSKIVFIGIDPSQNNTSIAFRFGRGGKVFATNLTKGSTSLQRVLEAFKKDGFLCYVGVERNTLRRGSWAASYAASCKAMREVVSSRATSPITRNFVGSRTWQSACGSNRMPLEGKVPKDQGKVNKLQSIAWSKSNGLDPLGDDNVSDAYGILTWVTSIHFPLYKDQIDPISELPAEVAMALRECEVLTT